MKLTQFRVKIKSLFQRQYLLSEHSGSLTLLVIRVDSKLTIETHLQEVVLKAARSPGVVHRAGKLFDCPRVLKSCFNAYILSNLEYCALVCRRSLIWVSWTVLFAVRIDCVRMSFVVWTTEEWSLPCV